MSETIVERRAFGSENVNGPVLELRQGPTSSPLAGLGGVSLVHDPWVNSWALSLFSNRPLVSSVSRRGCLSNLRQVSPTLQQLACPVPVSPSLVWSSEATPYPVASLVSTAFQHGIRLLLSPSSSPEQQCHLNFGPFFHTI